MVRSSATRPPHDPEVRPRRALLVALLCVVLAPALCPGEESTTSRYRDFIDDLLARWPAPEQVPPGNAGLSLTCIETPGEERHVGARLEVVMNAPLATVAATLDDIPHFRELYPDCVDVRVLEGSLRGIFQSGMAVKLRAENPSWTYLQIRAEAGRLWNLDEQAAERCRRSSQLATLR
jgi:hypothetical protein